MHRYHYRHTRSRSPRESFERCRHLGRGRGGPRARRGDIRAAVLALLEERPMHGYEMIKELEERTSGVWVPSAGSIYPTLQLLEDEGLIAGEELEGKRRFTLTDAGREQVTARSGDAPWEEVAAGYDPEMLNLRRSVHKLHHAYAQVFHAADPAQRKRVRELLDETRRKIYAILAEVD
ncbi:MAG TPA: PadR family transcriptional regulator [Solirubrobacterales bacterium]|nr:PadR family transcriptional regulator [Solirubrobacterales bacterium]